MSVKAKSDMRRVTAGFMRYPGYVHPADDFARVVLGVVKKFKAAIALEAKYAPRIEIGELYSVAISKSKEVHRSQI
ncbi:MAG: hypothetical protein WBD31_16815 [Rubripirellula sp.]